MADVNNERHITLQRSATEWLSEKGFYVCTAAYHDVLPREVKDCLSFKCWSPTALYLRGRSDNFAIQKNDPYIVFELEFKTHEGNAKNMAVEMLPLAHHIEKAKLGVECIYIYEDCADVRRGFWVDKDSLPKIDKIFLPYGKWDQEGLEFFRNVAKEIFPETAVIPIDRVKGSGDPFVVIPERAVNELPEWKVLIEARILYADGVGKSGDSGRDRSIP